jgi:hypothetical protein
MRSKGFYRYRTKAYNLELKRISLIELVRLPSLSTYTTNVSLAFLELKKYRTTIKNKDKR